MTNRRPKTRYRGMNPAKAAEIRRLYYSRQATQQALARRYGLAQSSISRIVSEQVWAHA